jgi:hypothetical protein
MKKLITAAVVSAALFVGEADAKWALVVNGSVTETWESKPAFHPDVMKSIKNVSGEVEPGWRKVGEAYYPPKTPAEVTQDAFDSKRAVLLREPRRAAHRKMSAEWKHKLTGDLATGYPDDTQPLCQTPEGEVLTLNEFLEYIQERDDDGATAQELKNLRGIAKDVRKYFRTLKP